MADFSLPITIDDADVPKARTALALHASPNNDGINPATGNQYTNAELRAWLAARVQGSIIDIVARYDIEQIKVNNPVTPITVTD